MNILSILDGKKTHIIVALAIVYIFGGNQGWWSISEEILALLGFGGLSTLRSGLAKAKDTKPDDQPKAPTMLPAIMAAGFLAIGAVGCSSVAPGNDPVVVNAERTTEVALEVFDTFVRWEYENRETLMAVPEVRRSADFIRSKAPDWLATARTMTKAYKGNRTDDNRVNLETALYVLRAGMREAQRHLESQ